MKSRAPKIVLTGFVACVFTLAMGACALHADPSQTAPPQAQSQAPAPGQPEPAQLTPEQLQELVAPIALYPDALVAQILAASAYPTQIVEAERFLQQNSNLQGEALGTAVDKQDWDPSVKALTQFPSVLADMDKNLSWTSALGDANYNQGADVMNAVQYMRQKAEAAGNLKSTPQLNVSNQGPQVVIQPADPDIVYVPDYDPEFVYGYPVGLWPGFYPWWGGGGPYLSFGVGYGISPFFGFGWGWHAWGFNWGRGGLFFGGHPYAFRSRAFYDRNAYFHGSFRGAAPYARGDRGARGFGAPAARGYAGTRSGAFGGITRGGDARGYASRGRASSGVPMRSAPSGGARAGGGGAARGGAGRGGGGGHAGGGRR